MVVSAIFGRLIGPKRLFYLFLGRVCPFQYNLQLFSRRLTHKRVKSLDGVEQARTLEMSVTVLQAVSMVNISSNPSDGNNVVAARVFTSFA